MEMTGSVRWRDAPIVPSGDDGTPNLVRLARQARWRVVEFDWVFTREDLDSLRRAVHAWGSPVVGRYKVFDAHVLRAINAALGEPDSPWVLKEPKGAVLGDCSVMCLEEAGLFRLRGHATFDLVFGYGSAGADETGRGWSHLSEAAKRTLAQSMRELGWDLARLNEDESRAVRNVVFGMSPSRGVGAGRRSSDSALDVRVHFRGAFSAIENAGAPCLFGSELASSWGVYLWTINVNGEERPWYVGQTNRSFASRIGEHIAWILSGQYSIFDAEALAKGELRRVGPTGIRWPDAVPTMLREHETWGPHAIAMVRLLRFYFAPMTEERLLDRVEGAIGRHYQRQVVDTLKYFFYPGLRVPAVIPFDRAIQLTVTSDNPLAGMPHIISD